MARSAAKRLLNPTRTAAPEGKAKASKNVTTDMKKSWKKAPIEPEISSGEEEGDEEGAVAEDGAGAEVEVDWTIDRTWKLVNGIEGDKSIREGLFPMPGGNKSISKGGSHTKTDFHWALAHHIFEDDDKYTYAFSAALDHPPDQKIWGRKIKNWLERIVKNTRGYMKEMGQMGMGIMKEDELDMSLSNAITNCWNLATSSKKTKTGIDWFADIIAREEETTQKALDVKKTKFQGETERAVAKFKAMAAIKMNKDRLKVEYAQKKLELQYQLELKKVKMGNLQQPAYSQQSAFPSAAGNSFSSGTGWQVNPASSSQASFFASSFSPTMAMTPNSGLTFTEQLQNEDLDDMYVQ